MVTELLKNSMRATVEFSRQIERNILPAIEITICQGDGGVTLRIRDQGGGVSEKDVPRIWEYSYTTYTNQAANNSA